ncbi:hypothetical protein [Demequina sp. NBRC 110056]|uniref:hypothetical protein n=1 Tax=Demequina sp. NBRC 110056 TaxID=1570345 RepID=UPI001356610B|nr:hypothetical protein [Demequina sp. NBRC 110056]
MTLSTRTRAWLALALAVVAAAGAATVSAALPDEGQILAPVHDVLSPIGGHVVIPH